MISLLAIQSTPLMESLTWPALPIFCLPIIFVAALISPRINVYIFYGLFGILLYGTVSFYLLPLAHLHFFKKHKIDKNAKILLLKIIPAWALEFIVGSIFSLFIVHALTGQIGIQPQDLRRPSYAHSFQDLIANTINSFHFISLVSIFFH